MVDEAVRARGPILIVVALESTLDPTLELLRSSAAHDGIELDATSVPCPDAWASFEAGDTAGYLEAVEATVRDRYAGHAAVVLARASMAPVAARCEEA